MIGIPAENIMITAVHDHDGPVTKAYENDVRPEVNSYVKSLQEKFISIAFKASEKVVPFRMGKGKLAMSCNNQRSG